MTRNPANCSTSFACHRVLLNISTLLCKMFFVPCYCDRVSGEQAKRTKVKTAMKAVYQHSIKAILGILLLQCSSTALAFTIIAPQAELAPSSSLTDSATLNTQIQPVVGAIKAHLYDARRKKKSKSMAQHGNVLLAANGDVDSMMFSNDDPHGGVQSLWINSTFTSLKNDFSRTRFSGNSHMLLAGFDYTLSDTYIFGVAFSHETSNIDTRFNGGNEQIDGFNISPYFAFLFSDSWSVDLSIGYGKFDTDQYRTLTVLVPRVDSDVSSTRSFVSTNLTNVVASGSWSLTSSLGYLVAKNKQEDYFESDSTFVAGLDLDIKQWNFAGEVAYNHRDSESYLGLIYEKDTDLDEVKFVIGEQPANDDDSVLLTAGWRYYGKDLTANFEFNSRVGRDELSDNGISTTLRLAL